MSLDRSDYLTGEVFPLEWLQYVSLHDDIYIVTAHEFALRRTKNQCQTDHLGRSVSKLGQPPEATPLFHHPGVLLALLQNLPDPLFRDDLDEIKILPVSIDGVSVPIQAQNGRWLVSGQVVGRLGQEGSINVWLIAKAGRELAVQKPGLRR